jgi:hypothetical protein
MVLHLLKSFIDNANTFSYLINKFCDLDSLIFGELVPQNEKVVGNTCL